MGGGLLHSVAEERSAGDGSEQAVVYEICRYAATPSAAVLPLVVLQLCNCCPAPAG